MRIWFIKQLLRGMNAKEKHAILTLAVRKYFSAITADDVLREDPKTKIWFFQGKALHPAEVKYLQAEAERFKGSKLWHTLEADMQYQANKRMFIDSKNELDMIGGKFILFTLDIIKTRLSRINAIKKLPTA